MVHILIFTRVPCWRHLGSCERVKKTCTFLFSQSTFRIEVRQHLTTCRFTISSELRNSAVHMYWGKWPGLGSNCVTVTKLLQLHDLGTVTEVPHGKLGNMYLYGWSYFLCQRSCVFCFKICNPSLSPPPPSAVKFSNQSTIWDFDIINNFTAVLVSPKIPQSLKFWVTDKVRDRLEL